MTDCSPWTMLALGISLPLMYWVYRYVEGLTHEMWVHARVQTATQVGGLLKDVIALVQDHERDGATREFRFHLREDLAKLRTALREQRVPRMAGDDLADLGRGAAAAER